MNKKLLFSKILAVALVFAVPRLNAQVDGQIEEAIAPAASVPIQQPVEETPPLQEIPARQTIPAVQPAPATQPIPEAQTPPKAEDSKRHEVKLDLIQAMLSTLQLSYEYNLSARTALELTAIYDFSTEPQVRSAVLLGYKLYLIKFKYGPFIFIEGNSGYMEGYNSKGWDWHSDIYYDDSKWYAAFTTGLAGGIKFFVPKTDLGLETTLYVNRLYGNERNNWAANFSVNFIARF